MWEDILSQLPQLIANGEIANAVACLPLLDASQLSAAADLQHAYVCLAFIIHGHVWGIHAASTKQGTPQIPPQLSEPFLEVCKRIGTEPVLSYSGLCLWNWRSTKDRQNCPVPLSLDHLETFGSFTGTIGEAAFYLVPVLIEAEGAHLIQLLLQAVRAASSGDFDYVKAALEETTATLDRMSQHLPKLYPLLDAKMFYHELRPFFSGGQGAEDKGLPRGMVFQRSDGSELDVKCIGGSAAQSSLFPFLDAVLGVSHGNSSKGSVFQEMRRYMPEHHRRFLQQVEALPSIRSFVAAHPLEAELLDTFNGCLDKLRSWRGKHMAVVSKYIVQPARAMANESGGETELQGTAGSSLISFLRQSRDETIGITKNL
ncbi:hypothetical protein VHEMI04129 [[Torrubiella] hemipterigena]|uniref:Indoleamine 2,3-dioxygenase n=1 Tax=[Torrubiella] hemipterigena TaxID=1531966 RepID=A0A0A1TFL0_9HYPO|nr:hypothetical protein VHEMI04129 [[Torrubiella] hemipterigena]